jgi:toxin ParE1/3/4
VAHRIEYRPAARLDLAEIYDWVAGRADPRTAIEYLMRIRQTCEKLAYFPDRGTPRDDIRTGLRTISFERRAVIAFMIQPEAVWIIRVLHGGRDVNRAFEEE